MTKSGTITIGAARSAPLPPPVEPSAGLPSPHVSQAIIANNHFLRISQQFQDGLDAVNAELEGQRQAHSEKRQAVTQRFKSELDAMDKAHEAATQGLLTKIKDLQNGLAMCMAALDKGEELALAGESPPPAEEKQE